jgi:hypothetical protein
VGAEDDLRGSAAFVSRRVIEGERPGYVERTADRMNAADTGWRLYVGDEAQDWLDAPGNCILQHLGHSVEAWPELREVVDAEPASGDWMWDAASRRYLPARF